MNKILLVIDYKTEKNKCLVLFINQITDFGALNADFLKASLKFKSDFESDESQIPEELCRNFNNELIKLLSEKNIIVTYGVYSAMNELIIYRHRYPHGKNHNFICANVVLLEVEDSKPINHDNLLDISLLIMSSNFKLNSEDKNADSLLSFNDKQFFHSDEFVQTEEYAKLIEEQNLIIKDLESTFSIKIKNAVYL